MKYTERIRSWISRTILVIGVLWMVVILSREFSALRTTFSVESVEWLVFTVAAGCGALLFTVPAFRVLLSGYAHQRIAYTHAARMLFVAQILRHLPGRIWGVMYLVNETHTSIPAASMVRANIDFMLYSMSMNLLVAASLFLGVMSGPVAGISCGLAGMVLLALGLRGNWVGALAGLLARVSPARMKSFAGAVAAQQSLSWFDAMRVALTFAVAWSFYLSIWWALPKVFTVLADADIWLLCASYSVAWVIGYLAMITPGGLGVREAGFFAIAAPLMSLSELTFLAVFVRLWQIVVESLLFVVFAFIKPHPQVSNDGNTTSA